MIIKNHNNNAKVDTCNDKGDIVEFTNYLGTSYAVGQLVKYSARVLGLYRDCDHNGNPKYLMSTNTVPDNDNVMIYPGDLLLIIKLIDIRGDSYESLSSHTSIAMANYKYYIQALCLYENKTILVKLTDIKPLNTESFPINQTNSS